MQRQLRFAIAAIVVFACLAAYARCQSLDSILNATDKTNLEILATHTAQKIRDADRTEKEPRVLVIDFFLGSPGVSSSLGTLLADRFSESLANSSRKIGTIDRKNFAEYLTQNWTTLEDLKNFPGCRYIGRELGATGIVLGSVYEQNGAIGLKIHLSGFGLSDESKSEFGDLDEVAWLSATEQTKDLLIKRGLNYARNSEQLREAPGALRADLDGFAMPTCVHCPDPPYADAARVAKVQGTVVLGVVITGEGKAGTIHVLKAAPFGLTAQAIKAVRNWEFKPAQQRDGTPVSMAVPIEVTYRMF
jgi:TonB family protein